MPQPGGHRRSYNRHRQGHGGRSDKTAHGSKDEDAPKADPNSPVAQAFLQYKNQLDTKHDKHEALVKISRDLTIESKRVIFHLHRCVGGDREKILSEGEDMLNKSISGLLRKMAVELENQDIYKFTRAITAGLQEFIEAFTFFHYLKHQTIPLHANIQSRLTFDQPSSDNTPDVESKSDEKPSNSESQNDNIVEDAASTKPAQAGTAVDSTDVESSPLITVPLSQQDFILGIADLSGELMRMAINCVGWGDMDTPVELCTVLQHLEMAYKTYCSTAGGEIGRKVQVLKQSVAKVENACYTLKVRGSEIPKHMLAGKLHTSSHHDHTNLHDSADTAAYDV